MVHEAFGFLETTYGYRFIEEALAQPGDARDTQADVTFAGEHMGVRVRWYFSSGIIAASFRKLQTPWQYADTLSDAERRIQLPVFADLYALARFLGAAQDPDFLLGDVWNVYQSKCKKRDALIKTNMRGVLDGLARATQRYAGHILQGDSSQFAEVRAFYDTHKDDYWQRKTHQPYSSLASSLAVRPCGHAPGVRRTRT
jgi:hypothetical protein